MLTSTHWFEPITIFGQRPLTSLWESVTEHGSSTSLSHLTLISSLVRTNVHRRYRIQLQLRWIQRFYHPHGSQQTWHRCAEWKANCWFTTLTIRPVQLMKCSVFFSTLFATYCTHTLQLVLSGIDYDWLKCNTSTIFLTSQRIMNLFSPKGHIVAHLQISHISNSLQSSLVSLRWQIKKYFEKKHWYQFV